MAKRRRARVDPELDRQLAAAASDQPVEAVAILRGVTPSTPVPELVDRILRRVGEQAGSEPADLNVFGNLGSFVLAASPEFLRRLSQDPDVHSLGANRTTDPTPDDEDGQSAL
jgi:hypothetical protein